MTRLLLSLFVSSTALAVGLATSWQQSENHARAKSLDETVRACHLVRAGNEALAAQLMQRRFEFDRDRLDARSEQRVADRRLSE